MEIKFDKLIEGPHLFPEDFLEIIKNKQEDLIAYEDEVILNFGSLLLASWCIDTVADTIDRLRMNNIKVYIKNISKDNEEDIKDKLIGRNSFKVLK